MAGLGNYLKKSVSTGLGNSLGSALITVIFIPLIINNIGMEEYGIWAILAIFIGISSMADVGLSKSMVYFIPRQSAEKDINEIYSAAFFLNTLTVLFIAIVGLAVYWSGINVWGNNKSISYELGRKILLYGLIITCCSLATSFYRSVLEAFYKIYIVNIGYLLLTVLNYTSLYFLSLFTNNIEYLIICTTVVYVIIFIFHFVLVRLITPVIIHIRISKFNAFRKIVKCAFGFFSISILNTLIQPANRYLIILLAGGAKVYAVFDIALKISMLARSCLQAFAVPLFSIFAGYGKARISEIKRLLNRYLIGLGGCYILGCLSFFIIGKHILNFALKGESTDLFNISLILMLGVSFFGVAEPFARALLALGDLRLSFNIKAVQIAANLLLIVLLAKLNPLYRFSLAYSLAFSAAAILYIVMFKRKYSNYPEELRQNYDYSAAKLPA